jgi:metallo-beta-lactamase family protein
MAAHATTSLRHAVVTFWGAAQSVTGSMHLVEAGGRKVLLDCGLVRGPHSHPHPNHAHFPFAPAELDAVVLTHAHVDHCGHLPRLVHEGYAGPIYCTPATCDLLGLILPHSARIQEEEAFVHHIVGGTGRPEEQAFFTQEDVGRALGQCAAVPYDRPWEVGPVVQLRLVNAGHILGSAMAHLTVAADDKAGSLTFTGDLGRRGSFLLRGPAPIPEADLLVSECTYGSRALEPLADAAAKLEGVVRDTAERGGKVLIPAFALGRAQVVVHVLAEAMRAGRVPEIPVYVDSAQAADIAAVYYRHPECLAEEAARQLRDGIDLLGGPTVRYVRDADERRALSARRGPCVIIAPGGMCQGGRILHHLKLHIDDPRCTVVLVNYQAPHTPGRQLLERGPTVRWHGRRWNKWAEVVYLPGFSGHADQADLLDYLQPLAGQVPKVRLVHGELEQAYLLAHALREIGFPDVAVPGRGESACFI